MKKTIILAIPLLVFFCFSILVTRASISTNLDWSEFVDISDHFELESNLQVRSWVGDFDNDNDPDALIGTTQSNLRFYRNIGTNGKDLWTLDSNYPLPIVPEQVTRVVPTAGDLDGDNDTDLIIGGDDGHLYVSMNNGNPQVPAWTEFSILRNSANQIFNFTGQANPTLIDYDNDTESLLDLLVGSDIDTETGRYQIYTYMNEGNRTHYAFGVVTYNWAGKKVPYGPKNITSGIIEINPIPETTGSLRIYFAFINHDARPDMILMFDSGKYDYYTASSLERDPIFLPIHKSEASVVFNLPSIDEEPFIDIFWMGLTSPYNITKIEIMSSQIFNLSYLTTYYQWSNLVSGGISKILVFRNSGEVLLYPPMGIFSPEETTTASTVPTKSTPAWSFSVVFLAFSLKILVSIKRKDKNDPLLNR